MKRGYVILGILAVSAAVFYLLMTSGSPAETTVESSRPEAPSEKRLEVRPEAIDRIHVVQNRWADGAYREEAVTLEKGSNGAWRLTSPVDYPANSALVAEMVTALGGMRLIPLDNPQPTDLGVLQLDDRLGIDVTVFANSKEAAHLVIGLSRDNTTYVRLADDPTVYRTPGHHRKVFDRTPSQWRSRVITDLDRGSVTRVTYGRGRDRFTMVKRAADGAQRFTPEGVEIENFDSDRALLKAEALTALRARDFCDRPVADDDLRGKDTLHVTVEATEDGAPVTIELGFGAKDTTTGLHYLATSASPQVFLVSPHLRALFHAAPKDFRRTPEQVERQRLWREKAEAHEREHERRRRASAGTQSDDDDGPGADPHL